MKALANHLILYDAECPMCSLYTKAFVKTGILEQDGRASYQQMPEAACPLVDRQRAMDEIALVNTETGEVNYGIKSLFIVFANMMPVFKALFNFRPFVWVMAKIYAFISFNRRVIIPAPMAVETGSMQPSFKLHYRVAYLLFTWLVTGFVLTHYAHLLTGLVPLGNPYREYLICGGQMLFQGMMISTFAGDKLWAYLGNMMTISFGGSLLLLPALLLHHVIPGLPAYYYLVYFMGVAGVMLLEHIRRSKLLGLGWAMSASWVTYRLLVLVLIYTLN